MADIDYPAGTNTPASAEVHTEAANSSTPGALRAMIEAALLQLPDSPTKTHAILLGALAHLDAMPAPSPGIQLTPQAPVVNAKQLGLAIGIIASDANVLASHSNYCYTRPEDSDAGTDWYMAAALASKIGAVADWLLGGECVGGIPQWLVVPHFDREGVRHG